MQGTRLVTKGIHNETRCSGPGRPTSVRLFLVHVMLSERGKSITFSSSCCSSWAPRTEELGVW